MQGRKSAIKITLDEPIREKLTQWLRQKLKPWRVHTWLSASVPRDAAFIEQVRHLLDLYVRDLPEEEQVWSLDEKTNVQPRPRGHRTRPACPTRPVQVEHEYQRAGAVNLIAAFNTRGGQILGHLS